MKRGCLLLPLLLLCLSGCGRGAVLDDVQTDLSTLTVPDSVSVAALGEASHGVKEYQEMKAQVFQALVKNNGCRTFIIEGDFGSALAVDEYIHGGDGTAQEAAAQIGFRIYRTQEMADLLAWMREYNQSAPEGEDLHFRGMDFQQVDGSKAYLFQVLEQGAPQLGAAYQERLSFLTDDTLFDQTPEDFAQGKTVAEELLQAMDAVQEELELAVGAEAFAYARECANSLRACCVLRGGPDLQYNTLRDQYMAEKVQWYLDQGDGSLLFLNGHNGHIGKHSTAGYVCLGQHLSEELGEAYFAIGTDAAVTSYNAQGNDGSFTETTVENENDLTALAQETEEGRYYVDFRTAGPDWEPLCTQEQAMSAMNVGFSPIAAVKAVPGEVYDGMIVFHTVTPTTFPDGGAAGNSLT